jgi:hypothetical protein
MFLYTLRMCKQKYRVEMAVLSEDRLERRCTEIICGVALTFYILLSSLGAHSPPIF